MSMPEKVGNCPIIATPFTTDGAVDYDSLRNEIEVIADRGCKAATMFGIASEFDKLSGEERRRVADVVTDTADEVGIASVLSVTHEATRVAVEHATEYEELGADCIMVFPPRQRGTVEEILDHLRRIGEAVDLPVMVQHTPRNADIEPEQFVDLHDRVSNIRYFKIELQPPGPYISELEEKTGEDVNILVGNWGYKMMDAYDRGAVGVMPISFYDELYVAIDRRYQNGDRQGAIELHDELLAFLNDIRGIPGAKWILADRGIIETPYCREPVGDTGDDVTDTRLEEAHGRMLDLVETL